MYSCYSSISVQNNNKKKKSETLGGGGGRGNREANESEWSFSKIAGCERWIKNNKKSSLPNAKTSIFFEANMNVRGVIYLCMLKKACLHKKMDRDRNKNAK